MVKNGAFVIGQIEEAYPIGLTGIVWYWELYMFCVLYRGAVLSKSLIVTDLRDFRNFSRSISAVFAWSSKLMVGGDSMGPGLQLIWARFFPSRKAITRDQTSPNVHIWQNSSGHNLVLCGVTVTWLGTLVVLDVLYMLIWPWPDPRSRSRSRSIWTSAICP